MMFVHHIFNCRVAIAGREYGVQGVVFFVHRAAGSSAPALRQTGRSVISIWSTRRADARRRAFFKILRRRLLFGGENFELSFGGRSCAASPSISSPRSPVEARRLYSLVASSSSPSGTSICSYGRSSSLLAPPSFEHFNINVIEGIHR